MTMFKKLSFALAAAILGFGAAAFAQSSVPSTLPNIGTSALVKVLPTGSPAVGDKFVHAYQVSGAQQYQNLGVATTGNTYGFTSGQVNMLMQPSGTLAAVTLTTEASPSDGQRECFLSTQTTTALTWNANTGQSISGAPTAGVANTPACVQYAAASATWLRSP